jgi:phenylpropionate dioxygenase-like ring-hydroxylating dioxygenase large terminal subunit
MPAPQIMIDGVELAIAPGRLLSPRAFTSAAIYAAEETAIWNRAWVHVADLCDLKEPGDYVTANIGETPVFLLRDRIGGELRGFLNACRHRGAMLLEGAGKCARQISCPYHAWSYGHDGRLIGLPFREEVECDEAAMGLIPVRIGTVGPMVFACLDANAPPLDAWAGALPAVLRERGVERWPLAWQLTYDVDANWKLFVENANEGYHIPVVHDVLLDLLADEGGETTMEPHGAYTWAKLNPAYVPPEMDPASAKIRFGCLFPNLIPVLSPVDLTYIRVDPIAPDRLRLFVRSFDDPANPAQQQLRELRKAAFQRTTDQDIAVVKTVQRGVRAAGLPAGVHARELEARIAHFERMWADAMARSAADGVQDQR